MIRRPDFTYALPVLLALGVPVLGGCAIGTSDSFDARAGLECVDDTAECVNLRQATLRHLVGDHDRAWVGEPASAEAYASGVRLFAFKAKKSELTCDELTHGQREARAARSTLQGASAKLTPAQVSRGAMLGDEVAKELGAEIGRRCKKG